MHNDLQDSIKARLYDMKYTPFLASYVFAWVFFNAKSFLIFFSDLKVEEKIEKLAYADLLYLYPLYIALFYTLVFPIFAAAFYYVTLQYKRLMNFIKQKIQDVTPLPQAEANELLRENAELRLEHNEKIKALNFAKSNFEEKEKVLQDEHNELQKLYKEAQENLTLVQSKLDERNAQIETLNQNEENFKNEINQKRSEYKKALDALKNKENEQNKLVQQSQKIKELEEKLRNYTNNYPKLATNKKPNTTPAAHKTLTKDFEKILGKSYTAIQSPIDKAISNLTDDEKTLLKIIYDNDISVQSSTTYINLISENNKKDFKKVKIRNLLDSLVKKELISLINGFYDTTAKGREVILKLFD